MIIPETGDREQYSQLHRERLESRLDIRHQRKNLVQPDYERYSSSTNRVLHINFVRHSHEIMANMGYRWRRLQNIEGGQHRLYPFHPIILVAQRK